MDIPLEQEITLEQDIDSEALLQQLETGEIRIAKKIDGDWIVNAKAKKAILRYFRENSSYVQNNSLNNFYDKISLRFANYNEQDFRKLDSRVVPNVVVRRGTYIGRKCVLMPSYINIGAFVDDKTMIDSGVTIGSCAQIGKNCHISSNVTIGGVLEPVQANPTIIEDNCFIGCNSSIVEGVIIEEGSVIANGTNISKSTKIYNKETKTITYGKIPKNSLVIPGNIPSKCKTFSLSCVVIVKKVTNETKSKVQINDLLREL